MKKRLCGILLLTLLSFGCTADVLGQLKGFDAQGVAELAVRLSLSFLLTPESCIPLDDDAATRAFARSYLVPALRSLSSSRKGRR